jgi:hypothetical protein
VNILDRFHIVAKMNEALDDVRAAEARRLVQDGYEPILATMTYRRAAGEWPEFVCSENIREYYYGKDSEVPRADKPDF